MTSGRAQTIRVVVQAAAPTSAAPIVLPGSAELVKPGAPMPRRSKF